MRNAPVVAGIARLMGRSAHGRLPSLEWCINANRARGLSLTKTRDAMLFDALWGLWLPGAKGVK